MFESQSSNTIGENTGPDSPKMFCSRWFSDGRCWTKKMLLVSVQHF